MERKEQIICLLTFYRCNARRDDERTRWEHEKIRWEDNARGRDDTMNATNVTNEHCRQSNDKLLYYIQLYMFIYVLFPYIFIYGKFFPGNTTYLYIQVENMFKQQNEIRIILGRQDLRISNKLFSKILVDLIIFDINDGLFI